MVAFLLFLLNLFDLLFKSKSQLAAENVALRQQVIALQRKVRGRVQLTDNDRLFFIQLYRWFPSVLNAITIVQPETLLRWHRDGFRRYWRWKSRNCGGRPPISAELRALIRRMSLENKLWGTGHCRNGPSCLPRPSSSSRRPAGDNVPAGTLALVRSLLVLRCSKEQNALHTLIHPPYAIMRRARPYRGENPAPGEDVDGELDPTAGIRERPRPGAVIGRFEMPQRSTSTYDIVPSVA